MAIVPSEKCAECGHDDFDHLDMGMCQVIGCTCEEFEWIEEDNYVPELEK